jgi:hypothetical protein
MRTESLEGKYIQLVSRIFNSSERIAGLVDDLLDLTKARFGMQLSLRAVNIGLLAEQVIEELRAAHPERMIVLNAAGDLCGSWDSGRIAQVICSLVSNALLHGSDTEPIDLSNRGSRCGDADSAQRRRADSQRRDRTYLRAAAPLFENRTLWRSSPFALGVGPVYRSGSSPCSRRHDRRCVQRCRRNKFYGLSSAE